MREERNDVLDRLDPAEIRVALRLAVETGRTVYDCLYVAAAVQADAILLTADERLMNALAATPWGKYVQLVG